MEFHISKITIRLKILLSFHNYTCFRGVLWMMVNEITQQLELLQTCSDQLLERRNVFNTWGGTCWARDPDPASISFLTFTQRLRKVSSTSRSQSQWHGDAVLICFEKISILLHRRTAGKFLMLRDQQITGPPNDFTIHVTYSTFEYFFFLLPLKL